MKSGGKTDGAGFPALSRNRTNVITGIGKGNNLCALPDNKTPRQIENGKMYGYFSNHVKEIQAHVKVE